MPAVALAQETTIDDDTYIGEEVYGNNDGDPRIPNGEPSNNSITIKENGTVKVVYGGKSTNDQDANSNTITIAGQITDAYNEEECDVIGGKANTGSANLNHVIVESTSNVKHSVYGGKTVKGPANNNTVEINGSVSHDAYGGYSEDGDVEGNTVIINNQVMNYGIGGYSATGKAINNTAILSDSGIMVTSIAGGRSESGTVELNQTIISGGYANIASGGYNINGSVEKNTLTIKDGEVGMGFGGFIEFGGGNGNANDNIVNVHGGTIDIEVAGGRSENGNAIGNTVNLYTLNDNINGSIYGGQAGAGKTSADNTVNFLGTAILPNATLEGSTIQNLNVYTTSNSVKDITGNIGNMHFYLPANISNGDTMLTVSNGIETNLDNTTINWSSASMPNLSDGEKVTLIYNANNLSTNGTILPGPRSYLRATGISSDTTYTFTTEREDTKAIVIRTSTKTTTGDGVTLPARTRSLVETRTAMTSLLSGGSDFVATQVMDEAEAVAIDPEISVVYGRLVPFAVFGGGSLNLDTGADVDLNSYYVNLGLTKEIKNRNGSLYLGPILEYGHGSYDSYSDNSVHGWGKGHYVGGGFFFRQRNHDGLYYEGDLRAGRVKSDYQGNLAEGLNADYTNSGSYIAGHLGFGKIFQLNKTDTMDTYLRYFYTRTSGEEVNIHSNMNEEMFNFDSVNSHRLRIGARYYHALNERSKLYAGLAYQYEFGGEATATHDGLSAPSTSLKGSSGMAELGWKVTSNQKVPMTVDLGVTAWAGKQKGVMGRLKLSWAF